MKVAILAGGMGTRLSEETELRPKPMVEVGDKPLIWHIMKGYASYGFNEFVVALGYKGEEIKRFFVDELELGGSLTVSLGDRAVRPHHDHQEDWTVHLIETGMNTMTGGRVAALAQTIGNETFMLTYGDGVSNVDIRALFDFHRSHGKKVTITAVRPPARFGALDIASDGTAVFSEKPQVGEGWINGGFMVLEPSVFELIEGPHTVLESDVLEKLSADGELMAFRHDDFWQCMDTLRDLRTLRGLWQAGDPPWVTW